MKSKFFGLGAKLALAFLAVGTMTSCYDSENGDVTKPYVAPDPVYMISGTITDVETGAPLNATVKVNNTPVTLTDGVYSVQVNAGSNTVTAELDGYNNDEVATRTVNIATIAAGQSSTTVVNIALLKNKTDEPSQPGDQPGDEPEEPVFDMNLVKMDVAQKEVTNKETYSVEEYEDLYAIAYDEALSFDWTFKGINIGSEITPSVEEAFAAAPAEAKEALIAYAKGVLGVYVGIYGERKEIDAVYTVSIAPYNELKALYIDYKGTEATYTFGYGDSFSTSIVVKALNSFTFSKKTESFTHDHGHGHGGDFSHGHGHGHGGNLNAGGGIFDSNY